MDTQSSNWPKDAIGNDLRKGALVNLVVPDRGTICRVVDVVKAGVMHGPDNAPMTLHGSVSFLLQIPYSPDQASFMQALVLKEPEAK